MEKQEQDTKKITMLRKIGYLFDRKQKIQFVGLGILILIGGLLETMSVSMLVPVVQGIMDPQALVDNSIMQKITGYLHIDMTTYLGRSGEPPDRGDAGGADDPVCFKKRLFINADLCTEYVCHT